MKKKKSKYLNIQDWMIDDLHLKGNDLLAYALIYGFSQDNESMYNGSYAYVMYWLSVDERSAIRILKRLESMGLIKKWKVRVNGVLVNRWTAMTELPEKPISDDVEDVAPEGVTKCHPCQNVTPDKMSVRGVTKCQSGGDKMSPNNLLGKPKGKTTPSCARGAHGENDTPETIFEGYAGGDEKLLAALKRFDRYRQSRRGRTWDAQQAQAVCEKLTQLADESKAANRSEYMIAAINQSIEAGWSVLDHPKGFGMMQGFSGRTATRNILPDRNDAQTVDTKRTLAAIARISKRGKRGGTEDE